MTGLWLSSRTIAGMPLWVSIYLAAYVAFTLWSVVDDVRNKEEPFGFTLTEIVSDICLISAALSFWLLSVRSALGQMDAVVFLVGIALFAGLGVRSLRRNVIADPELDLRGKVFVAITGSAMVIVFSAPLLVWGFMSGLLGQRAGS